MSEVAISNEIVQWTRNDVSPTVGQGKYLTEQNLAAVLNKAIPNYVTSGLTVPTSASLTATITAGGAFLSGYKVTTTATNITVGASATTYLWLFLKKDVDGNVTEAKFEINTSGTATYPDSLLLAVLTSSGTAITAVSDRAARSPYSGEALPFWAAVRYKF